MIEFIQIIPTWFFIIILIFWVIGLIIYNILFKKKEIPIETKEQFVKIIKNDIPDTMGFLIAFLIIYFKSDFIFKEILSELSSEHKVVILVIIIITITFLCIQVSKVIWKLFKK